MHHCSLALFCHTVLTLKELWVDSPVHIFKVPSFVNGHAHVQWVASGLKETGSCFMGGLLVGPHGVPSLICLGEFGVGGRWVWRACENQKKVKEAVQAAALLGGERGSGCRHAEGGAE